MTPTVLERNSVPRHAAGRQAGAPLLDRRAPSERGKHKAVRLVFHNGGNEYWGIEETDWDDAPALADKSFRHDLGGREFDLYYSGSHLHMVVLHAHGATLLGREHAARRPVERDDARDRQGSQTANNRQVRFRAAMSKVGIFGAGWVGLVTGACFAELGHEVVIRDVVPEKIDALQRGAVPFHEEQRAGAARSGTPNG